MATNDPTLSGRTAAAAPNDVNSLPQTSTNGKPQNGANNGTKTSSTGFASTAKAPWTGGPRMRMYSGKVAKITIYPGPDAMTSSFHGRSIQLRKDDALELGDMKTSMTVLRRAYVMAPSGASNRMSREYDCNVTRMSASGVPLSLPFTGKVGRNHGEPRTLSTADITDDFSELMMFHELNIITSEDFPKHLPILTLPDVCANLNEDIGRSPEAVSPSEETDLLSDAVADVQETFTWCDGTSTATEDTSSISQAEAQPSTTLALAALRNFFTSQELFSATKAGPLQVGLDSAVTVRMTELAPRGSAGPVEESSSHQSFTESWKSLDRSRLIKYPLFQSLKFEIRALPGIEACASTIQQYLIVIRACYKLLESAATASKAERLSFTKATSSVHESLTCTQDDVVEIQYQCSRLRESVNSMQMIFDGKNDSVSPVQSLIKISSRSAKTMKMFGKLIHSTAKTVHDSLRLLEITPLPMKPVFKLDSSTQVQPWIECIYDIATCIESPGISTQDLRSPFQAAIDLFTSDVAILGEKLKEGKTSTEDLSIGLMIETLSHVQLCIFVLHDLIFAILNSMSAILTLIKCSRSIVSPDDTEMQSVTNSALHQLTFHITILGDFISRRDLKSIVDESKPGQPREVTKVIRSTRLTSNEAFLIVQHQLESTWQTALAFLERMAEPARLDTYKVPGELHLYTSQLPNLQNVAYRFLTESERAAVEEASSSIAEAASVAVRNLVYSLSSEAALHTLRILGGKPGSDPLFALKMASKIKSAAEEELIESADGLAASADYLLEDNDFYYIDKYLVMTEIRQVRSSPTIVTSRTHGLIVIETMTALSINPVLYLKVVLQCKVPSKDFCDENEFDIQPYKEFTHISPGSFELFMQLGRGLHYRARGLPQNQINSLPCLTFSTKTQAEHNNYCVLCKGSYEDGNSLKVLNCIYRHYFHPLCIESWLRVSTYCPICWYSLGSPEEDSLEA